MRQPATPSQTLKRRVPRDTIPCLVMALGVILTLAPSAHAQDTAPPEPTVPFRRWDISGGIGLEFLNTEELGDPDPTYWESKGQLRLQLGRYFTQHLKVEFEVSGPNTYNFFETERIPVAGLPNGGFGFTDRDVTMVTLMPAFTYQFLENVFAHPFVSGGASIEIQDHHRHRHETTSRVSGVTYVVPALDSRRHVVLVRPFVAGGFKSYFNESVFVRPEVQTALTPSGPSRVALRLDVGVDF